MLLLKKSTIFTSAILAILISLPAQANVVASIKPLGFIAAAIADGIMPVEILLPDGASEHNYSLRPSDLKKIKNATLVIWIGPKMENFMAKSITGLHDKKNIEIANMQEVKPLLLKENNLHNDEALVPENATINDSHQYYHGNFNMHLWLSPIIGRLVAIEIHEKLLELMPERKNKLDANLQYFESKLANTNESINTQFKSLRNKGYFVFHDAYTYFEKYYGLSPRGHFTINPEIQPGVQRLHQIRTQLVEQKAVCVFAEPQFRPAVINVVTHGMQIRKGTLDPLGTNISLSPDSYVNFLSQLSGQYASCLNGE
ncbi:zinc ABC transporter substrate-binding protein ZnuA [Pantoea sp. Nvir]|uniref:zinc ABC transporter substrate-binding protein ZnuA n=1 Tax=Pantoea sp. Nvir TaxID=2576760 RepID=UPI00135C745D|nr:zinc ABC transporter substrate-binding protein ZnuA [Pantoea sp. Nvir]MXP66662.1 zinc ABC transporter substrate-binding protein ZnuA [Pantoea sp. Nvir]CAJ0991912.1 High-affinity zinc uptake system protein ZnuA [Pantoea sp. Nvir]